MVSIFVIGALSMVSATASARPGGGGGNHGGGTGRYEFIGSFESSNPLSYDRDTVESNLNDWTQAMIFELDRGNSIEIRDITVNCFRRPRCAYSRGGTLNGGRGVRVAFRRDLMVESIQVESKPKGINIPPARVNVYLERSRDNGGGW